MAPGRYPRLPEKSEAVRATNGARREIRFLLSEEITEALWGARVSPSTVSELNQKIYGQIESWRNRPITSTTLLGKRKVTQTYAPNKCPKKSGHYPSQYCFARDNGYGNVVNRPVV